MTQQTDTTQTAPTEEKPKGEFTPGRWRDPELAREAQRKSAEGRRAKKAAAAELAQWNAMAVKQRAAVTISKAASAERLDGVLNALLDKAQKGDTRAATEVRAWLALGASLTEEDETKDGELTPAHTHPTSTRSSVTPSAAPPTSQSSPAASASKALPARSSSSLPACSAPVPPSRSRANGRRGVAHRLVRFPVPDGRPVHEGSLNVQNRFARNVPTVTSGNEAT